MARIRKLSRPRLKNLTLTKAELMQRLTGTDEETLLNLDQIGELLENSQPALRHQPSGLDGVRVPYTANTGFDLTQSGLTLKFLFIDDTAARRPWSINAIDVDSLRHASQGSGGDIDTYIHIYDNDYVRVNVLDLASGQISLVDTGRHVRYVYSELSTNAIYHSGESVYQIAVRNGFDGTEQEWIDSLGAIR